MSNHYLVAITKQVMISYQNVLAELYCVRNSTLQIQHQLLSSNCDLISSLKFSQI